MQQKGRWLQMSNIGNKQTFAKNLLYHVERSGKTQRDICEIIGVSPSTFNEWVKGRKYPRIDKIEMLANFFGINKSDLIEEKLTDEQLKSNDIISSIIVRMRMDQDFLSVVETLYSLDSEKISGVKQMLNAFLK